MKCVCVRTLTSLTLAGMLAACSNAGPSYGPVGADGKADATAGPYSSHYLGKLACAEAHAERMRETYGADALAAEYLAYRDCLRENTERATLLQEEVNEYWRIDSARSARFVEVLTPVCDAAVRRIEAPQEMLHAGCLGLVQRMHADLLDAHLHLYNLEEEQTGRIAPIDRRSRAQHLFPSCWQSFDYDANIESMERVDGSRIVPMVDQIGCMDNELRARAPHLGLDEATVNGILLTLRDDFCGHYSTEARPWGQEQSTSNALCVYDLNYLLLELFNRYYDPRPNHGIVNPQYGGQQQCSSRARIANTDDLSVAQRQIVQGEYQECMRDNLAATFTGALGEGAERTTAQDLAVRFEESFGAVCDVLVPGEASLARQSHLACESKALEQLATLVSGHLPHPTEGYNLDTEYFRLMPADRREQLQRLGEEVWNEGRVSVVLDRLDNGDEDGVALIQAVIAALDDNLRQRMIAGRAASEDLDGVFGLRIPFCDFFARQQQEDLGRSYHVTNAQCALDYTLSALEVVDLYGDFWMYAGIDGEG